MTKLINHMSFLVIILLSLNQYAYANVAIVVALQEDAWIHRDKTSYPVRKNMQLKMGDQIRTGAKARVILKLPDDSIVKLGEYTIMNMETLLNSDENGIFKATLNVLRGAFRFTSTRPAKRDITLKIGPSLTAGIRGTDVWGSAGLKNRALICLIEGKVEVKSDTDVAILKNARDFYIAPNGKAALPVATLSESQLQLWAQSTELQPASN